MNIVFTGTQDGMTPLQARKVRQTLLRLVMELQIQDEVMREDVVVLHGGCVGADEEFHKICLQHGLRVVVYPGPNTSKRARIRRSTKVIVHNPMPDNLLRNKLMVDLGSVLIAAPKQARMIQRSGTWSTVRRARKKGLPIYICWPSGRLAYESGSARSRP